jgi:hypothetical protein
VFNTITAVIAVNIPPHEIQLKHNEGDKEYDE